ncbi:MAG: hypothetical protein ACREJS_05425 [Candidatus Rokuibacteriota bacterium]
MSPAEIQLFMEDPDKVLLGQLPPLAVAPGGDGYEHNECAKRVLIDRPKARQC